MLTYPVSLEPDDNGTVLVTFPDFPDAVTFGDDRGDAMLRAVDALETVIASRIASRQPLPAPTDGKCRVDLPTQTAIKVILYRAMTDAGLRKADLARRLSWHAPQIDRLLDINHATRFDQIDAALAAMGKRVSIEIEDSPPPST